MCSYHKSFKLNGRSFPSEDELLGYLSTGLMHQFLVSWFSSDDFVEVSTSGSTGNPKLIKIKKEHMRNSAKATGVFFNLPPKTKALLCLPIKYIAGKMMLVRALTLGWHLDFVEAVSEVDIKKKYDFSAMVPLQLQSSLAKINYIKKLIVGGAVVSDDLIQKIQFAKTDIFATYGMTETVTHIAVKKLNNFKKSSIDKIEEEYKTLPNILVETDSRGCLVINAPKVSSQKIITNDVVDLLSKTEFRWLGRFDNVINSGGIKLHPERIEEKLSSIIKNCFFITGVFDEKLGEKCVLIVEANKQKPNNYNVSKKKILDKISKLNLLSKYELPKDIYFVDKFVYTKTNKIQRNKTLIKTGIL